MKTAEIISGALNTAFEYASEQAKTAMRNNANRDVVDYHDNFKDIFKKAIESNQFKPVAVSDEYIMDKANDYILNTGSLPTTAHEFGLALIKLKEYIKENPHEIETTPVQSDAVEFGKFILDNTWIKHSDTQWQKRTWLNISGSHGTTVYKTTEELYELFIKSKND